MCPIEYEDLIGSSHNRKERTELAFYVARDRKALYYLPTTIFIAKIFSRCSDISRTDPVGYFVTRASHR